MRPDTKASPDRRHALRSAPAGVRAPMAFASFHDHARLPWRFHALLNASSDILPR